MPSLVWFFFRSFCELGIQLKSEVSKRAGSSGANQSGRVRRSRLILFALLFLSNSVSYGGFGHLHDTNQTIIKPSADEKLLRRYASEERSVESTEVFHKFMNDPFVETLWHAQQKVLLRTVPDRIMDVYISTDPILNPLRYNLEKNNPAMLAKFLLFQRQEVRLITTNSDSKSLKVRRLVHEVAKELGFNAKVIENMQLFLQKGGDINAFTTSGSIDHIIVSINDELVDQLPSAHLKAIVAHELFHIIFGHINQRLLMDVVFAALFETLTKGVSIFSMDDSRYSGDMDNGFFGVPWSQRALMWSENSSIDFGRLKGKSLVRRSFAVRNESLTRASITDWLRNSKPDASKKILKDVFHTIMELPVKEKREFLINFIGATRDGLVAAGSEVRPAVLSYLDVLQGFLFEDLDHRPHLDPLEMLAFFDEISNVYSRSSETSADMGASSLGSRQVMAEAISLFIHGDRKLSPLDRYRSVMNAQEAYLKNQTIFSDDPGLFGEVLEGATHPDPNMRIYKIKTSFQLYPLILFAHPFMRLILLEQSLAREQNEALVFWTDYKLRSELDKEFAASEELALAGLAPSDSVAAGGKSRPSRARLPAAIKVKKEASGVLSLEELKAHFGEKRKSVSAEIIRLVLDLEKVIEKEGARNPRFDNIFQFMAGRMQYILQLREQFEEQLKSLKKKEDPNLKDYITQYEAYIKTYNMELNQRKVLIKELLEAYEGWAPETEAQIHNRQDRLAVFEKWAAVSVGEKRKVFNLEAITAFQRELTPNNTVEGVTDELGRPVYYRSRITPGRTCQSAIVTVTTN